MNKLKIECFPALSYAGQEAVNTLCTSLSFSGDHVKRIMITSSHVSEGKSFVTMNVMRSMAMLGKRVVMVDADLRRSRIRGRYKLVCEGGNEMRGLAHHLAGMAPIEDVIYQTDIPGAYIVPVGRTVSNPLQLLNSERMGALLEYLAGQVDYVLVDAPPVGTVIDAAEIAKSCDGTVLVINYNTTRRRELIDAKQQIDRTGCPILGVVMNQIEYDRYLSKKYYYKAYYSAYEPEEKSGKR